jgi:hypothetical protein
MILAAVLAVCAVVSWTALFVWHWFGRGKPMKVTPLLRLFRR